MNTNQEQDAGVFYVKFDDRNEWNYEAAFVFKASESDTYLPSNSYSLEKGTILENSYINSSYARDWSSAIASVVFENGAYIISLNFEDETTIYSAIYEGEIEGMTVGSAKTLDMEECYFLFGEWYSDDAGNYYTQVTISDIDISDYNFEGLTQYHCLYVHSSYEYLNGYYPYLTAEEASAQNIVNYIEKDEDWTTCAVYDETGEPFYQGEYANFELYADTAMPNQDNNIVNFEATLPDGTICRGSKMGAIYGSATVSTEPVDNKIAVSSIDLELAMGGYYALTFHTLEGNLYIWFLCYSDTKLAGGAYVFDNDEDDPADMSFQGTYVVYGIDGDDSETEYNIESGTIGVVRPTTDGGTWTFQFKNVIARAENGSARNIGPLDSDGNPRVIISKTISGLE